MSPYISQILDTTIIITLAIVAMAVIVAAVGWVERLIYKDTQKGRTLR